MLTREKHRYMRCWVVLPTEEEAAVHVSTLFAHAFSSCLNVSTVSAAETEGRAKYYSSA
jgi:hypothetical protein